jgi:TP901 family phage tail tape measure protein
MSTIKETRVTTYFDADATPFKEEVRQIEKTLDGVSDTAKQSGGVFGKFGQDVATGIGVGFGVSTVSMVSNAIGLIKDGIATMVETGIEYEATMSKVQAITNSTGAEMAQMSELAMELGAKTSKSATESAEAMTYMGMAGWNTQEILAGLPGVIDLSIASGEDLARTSDIVTDNLTAFGMSAEDASYYADVLSYSASNANVTVDSLGESLKYVAPVATGAGVAMEETVAMVSLLGDAGIKGSQAGTTLRSVILNLTGANEKATAKLKELGVAIYDESGKMRSMTDIIGDLSKKLVDANGNVDTTTANLLVGKTAISGFTALLQAGGERLGSFTDALETSNGTADRMASTMQNNVKGALEELGGAFESIGLKIYDKIDAPLKDAINGFTNFIEKVGGLKEVEPTFTVFGQTVSESTYNALKGVEDLTRGIETHMATLDLMGGTVTPGFVNQMNTSYTSLKDGILTTVNRMHDEELGAIQTFGAERLGMTETEIQNIHTKMDEYKNTQIAKVTELEARRTAIMKEYQGTNKIMTAEHQKELLGINEEYKKLSIEVMSQEVEDRKGLLKTYASDSFTITKENCGAILRNALEHKTEMINTAQEQMDEVIKQAGRLNRIGVITDEEYGKMVTEAQKDYDKLVEEAEGAYGDVANAVHTKLGIDAVKEAKTAGEDVYDEFMTYIKNTQEDVKEKEINPVFDGSEALKDAKQLMRDIGNALKKTFTVKVNVNKTTTHKNVYENVGKPSNEILNRHVVPARNAYSDGMARNMSSTINFNGQYSFGNRNDIDYFMKQTARMIDRKY